MSTHARALPAIIAALALAAPATAAANPVRDDLRAAERLLQTGVPAERWNVIADATLKDRGHAGEATGIKFTFDPAGTYTDDRGRWSWRVERYEFTIDPQYQGCERRHLVLHEMAHFKWGPSHEGPMSPDALKRLAEDGALCEPERELTARELVRELLPTISRPWRVICAPSGRCVARSDGANWDRWFRVRSNGDVDQLASRRSA